MNEQLFRDYIADLSGLELEHLKQIIDEQIQIDYEKKDNFMLHDTLDDYLYVVYFENGTYHSFCKGKDAYERDKEDDAVKVVRKSKDLFPTIEILLEKNNEQERVRH